MCLVASQLPHGQFATLLIVFHGSVDKVDSTLGLNLRKQRMQSAVGIPQREDGVHLATLVGHMYLIVSTTVTAILVAPQVR